LSETNDATTNPQRPNRRPLYILSAVLFVLIFAMSSYVLFSAQNADDTTPEINRIDSVGEIVDQPLTNFTFPASTGEDLSLSDFAGQYVMLSFGYTSCPDVCPATLLEFRRIKAMLSEDANIAFVFISVDGGRDTPQILDRYVQRFDPTFIGLQGDDTQLQDIQDEYGLIYDIQENENTQAGYMVTHTASKFLINPEGDLIRVYSFTAEAQAIADELRSML